MFKFVVILVLLGVALSLPTNSTNKDVGPRIVGGEETNIERNPWQLALLYYGRQFCGAVAIHPRWALTVATCLVSATVDSLSIRAGSSTRSFGGQVIDVISMYIHPDYNRRTFDYDFALLHLDEPITIQTAASIALPEPGSEVLVGETATITGWGVASSVGLPVEILRRVDVPIVSQEICQLAYPHYPITDRMFCAGDLIHGGKDACRGDGGGPVVVNGKLAGLASFGDDCGLPDIPGVHSKVSFALDWIYQTTGI